MNNDTCPDCGAETGREPWQCEARFSFPCLQRAIARWRERAEEAEATIARYEAREHEASIRRRGTEEVMRHLRGEIEALRAQAECLSKCRRCGRPVGDPKETLLPHQILARCWREIGPYDIDVAGVMQSCASAAQEASK